MSKLKFVILILLTIFIVPMYVLVGTTPASAGTWPGLTEELCMADAYLLEPGNSLSQGALNCTANDVEITQVTPVNANEECTPGEVFTFPADIRVRTNARERWDTTFYLPLTDESPQVVQGSEDNCSIVLPNAWDIEGAPVEADLDSDECSDITKASGDDEYTLSNEPVTMLCTPDPNDPTRALFTYCAAWDNQERDNCTGDVNTMALYYGQIPNTKSKCKCDSFPINVFIKPEPPTITKTLVGTNTYTEFGGEFTFNLSFTNPSSASSLFIQSLTDEIDLDADGNTGGSWDGALDLWGSVTEKPVPDVDGVYLTESNCTQPANGGELLPSDTYSCQFKVWARFELLPGLLAPQLIDDAIKVLLWDKNGAPVVDGSTCTDIGLLQADGEHCSNIQSVQVTNLMPNIRVEKEAVPNSVTEPGDTVTFQITVHNDATVEPLLLTYLKDLQSDGMTLDLDGGFGTCDDLATTDVWIDPGSSYSCSFDYFVAGRSSDPPKEDTVTAKGVDNEGNEDTDTATAMVTITDTPSVIELIKGADKTVIDEPGEWVVYNFTVTNLSTVDTVFIDSLTDTIYGDLTVAALPPNPADLPPGYTIPPGSPGTTCDVTPPVELAPGANYPCTYTVFVLGDDGDKVYNIATASGVDEDGASVSDSDDHEITVNGVPPAASLTKEVTSMIVTYEVVVTNDSLAEALVLDVLNDDKFGDITTVHGNVVATTCTLPAEGVEIPIGGNYTCTFDGFVDESPHTDTVTGDVYDDDANLIQPFDDAIVTFGNP